MKLLDFCRDSDVSVAINKANNGTYDVQFQGKEVSAGLTVYEAWLMLRNAQLNNLKVPTKFMHEMAHLAIQLAHESTPTWHMDVDKLNKIVDRYRIKYNVEEPKNAE
jgi:hypothetical protein